MRVFQKRILSGKPSRSRGPGSNSRKKSASWASKDRKPFGTILRSCWSEDGVADDVAPDRLDAIEVEGGAAAVVEPGPTPLTLGPDCWLMVCSARKCRRSSAMSLAV